jgi:hypothetical protein
MPNYTSSLPDGTLAKLNDLATRLDVPKNKIIEKALNRYMTELEKQLYIKSFKSISGDADLLMIAEEGIADYNNTLLDWDEKR